MKKLTESGAFVLFPFRPLPIGLVFTDKAVFDTAQRRYSAAVTVYGMTLLLLLAGFWSVENEPDWAFKLAYAGHPDLLSDRPGLDATPRTLSKIGARSAPVTLSRVSPPRPARRRSFIRRRILYLSPERSYLLPGEASRRRTCAPD